MMVEAVAAVLLGLLVLWLVLQPLTGGPARRQPSFEEPEELEETRRGVALLSLKEIDFDRATGKLSEEDHALLKERYTREALAALAEERPGGAAQEADAAVERLVAARVAVLRSGGAAEAGPACPRCGPRPEPDAQFCSACGGALGGGACGACHRPVTPGSRFCGECGARLAA
jgi:hypothetical protein